MKQRLTIEIDPARVPEVLVENAAADRFVFLKVWDAENARYLLPCRVVSGINEAGGAAGMESNDGGGG